MSACLHGAEGLSDTSENSLLPGPERRREGESIGISPPPAPTRPEPEDPALLLQTAIAHLERGDARAALLAASEACHDAPQLPQAHYVYGQAWLALSEAARAEQAFAAALQLAPAWAEAWVNYGVARYRQGAVEDAKTAMRQALLAVPGHLAASANLGAFLRITGEAEAAEVLLRATIAREPKNAGARLNLAADLLRQPINARGLGRWRTYAAELAPLIAELERADDNTEASSAPTRTKV